MSSYHNWCKSTIDIYRKCLADCPDRTSDCHATCERYAEDHARNAIMNILISANKKRDDDYDDYLITNFQKTAKKRR